MHFASPMHRKILQQMKIHPIPWLEEKFIIWARNNAVKQAVIYTRVSPQTRIVISGASLSVWLCVIREHLFKSNISQSASAFLFNNLIMRIEMRWHWFSGLMLAKLLFIALVYCLWGSVSISTSCSYQKVCWHEWGNLVLSFRMKFDWLLYICLCFSYREKRRENILNLFYKL